MTDFLIRAELTDQHIRATVANSHSLSREITSAHQCQGVAETALKKAINASLLCSPLLQEGERFTMRWQYAGELQTILVDVAHSGQVRARPDCSVLSQDNHETAYGIGGKVGVVKSNPHRRLNSGMTLADRNDPALDLATYFEISEQVPTSCINVISQHHDLGIMLQLMPKGKVEDLETCTNASQQILEEFSNTEWNNNEDMISSIQNLFHGLQMPSLKIHETITPSTFCTCSKEKFISILHGLPADELRDMITKDGGAQIDCDFCGSSTRFEASDLQKIIADKS
jgi:molecular chaperone Hsp33